MKRIVCILLAFLVLSALVGCNDSVPSTDKDQTGDQSNIGSADKDEEQGKEPGEDESVSFPLWVMSYNVKTGNALSVADRAETFLETVRTHNPDLLGAQEINCFWLDELDRLGFFEEYATVGEPRMGPDLLTQGNEYSSIFYKKDVFDLVDQGTYWLSETPEEISKHSGADYYRIMTFAVLCHKESGDLLLHVNTHLEWNHADNTANTDQTGILLELTQDIQEQYENPPTVFTGDFNENPTSDGHALMLAWGNEDAREVAEQSSELCTFYDGYRGEWTNPDSEGEILDYCFLSADDFTVKSFAVDVEATASDHFPVIAEIWLQEQAS